MKYNSEEKFILKALANGRITLNPLSKSELWKIRRVAKATLKKIRK